MSPKVTVPLPTYTQSNKPNDLNASLLMKPCWAAYSCKNCKCQPKNVKGSANILSALNLIGINWRIQKKLSKLKIKMCAKQFITYFLKLLTFQWLILAIIFNFVNINFMKTAALHNEIAMHVTSPLSRCLKVSFGCVLWHCNLFIPRDF